MTKNNGESKILGTEQLGIEKNENGDDLLHLNTDDKILMFPLYYKE